MNPQLAAALSEYFEAIGALPEDILHGSNIAAWGDSLTAGSYPLQLADKTGYTVFNGGMGGDTSTQIKTRMLATPSRHSDLTIIWARPNNYDQTATVKADIAEMVSALGHDRYLVIGGINGEYSYEYSGNAGWTYITTLNADLATIYGAHFIDIRAYLVSLYNPAIPQDITDHVHDIVPSSLRVDNIHLTDIGYGHVVTKIIDNLVALQGTPDKFIAVSRIMDLFRNPPPLGLTTPNQGNFSKVKSPNFTTISYLKPVTNGSTVDLLKIGSYATGAVTGLLTVISRAQVGAGLTIKNYSLAMIGSGIPGGLTPLSSEDYGGGGAAFSLSETRDSPSAGENKISFVNGASKDVYMTISLMANYTVGNLSVL